MAHDVVSEIIAGEAVILHLRSGIYFSADGLGALIWDGIVAGYDTAEIEARIQAATSAETARIAADVAAFVATLVGNELIRPGARAVVPGSWTLPLPASPLAYVPPVLERHGDLQDLAALDPIHDVHEDMGWPNRRTDI